MSGRKKLYKDMSPDERKALPGGPKMPYDENDPDDCDHDFEFDEDTGEYRCHCGAQHRPDLTDLI